MQHAALPIVLQRANVSLRACSAKAFAVTLQASLHRSGYRDLAVHSSLYSAAANTGIESSQESITAAEGTGKGSTSRDGSWQGQPVLASLKAPASLAAGLYIVATPIGNLEDITLRALRVLRDADLVLAEDTRHTRKLLSFFGLSSQLHSFHEHNEHSKEAQVLQRVRGGAAVALVSDAGVPAVSDPGAKLVAAAIAAGLPVVPVPGPSAVLAALVASGLSCDAFQFVGFLPVKPGQRQKQLQQLAGIQATFIFFVPPHGLAAALADMASVLGSGRRCVIARELTKVHEEFHRGTLEELAAMATTTLFKGEMTLVVQASCASEATAATADAEMQEFLQELVDAGMQPSQAAKIVSKRLALPRGRVYEVAMRLAGVQR